MNSVGHLLTDHFDIWASSVQSKSSVGRGRKGKVEFHGIGKLRQLILELAVKGLLVPQSEDDVPATRLLDEILNEKKVLHEKGEIKKPKAIVEPSNEEKRFSLPIGWAWVRFETLFLSIASGGTPSKREPEYWNGNIPWASVKDLGDATEISETQDHITPLGLDNGSRLASAGDVLICTRMGLGKIAIVTSPIAFNQDLKAVSLATAVDPRYFLIAYSTIKIVGTGTTVAGIKQDELLGYVIGLPPIAEQHRIVAKVDELMALSDQLEQQQEASISAHETLVETLLGELTNAADKGEFNQAWERISDNFDTLFTTEHSVEQLKKTILQLAVMGKLVRSIDQDESASALVERFSEHKAKLITAKMLKKQNALVELTEQDIPFDVPERFHWCRLQEIVYLLGDGLHGTPEYSENDRYHFINGNNLHDGVITIKPETKTVSEEQFQKHGKPLNQRSVLVSINGTLGNVAFFRSEKVVLGKSACYFNLAEEVSKDYIKVLIESPYFLAYADEKATGSTIKNLGLAAMRNLPVPLPPKSEQLCIAERVRELSDICELLKLNIQKSESTRVALADAISSI